MTDKAVEAAYAAVPGRMAIPREVVRQQLAAAYLAEADAVTYTGTYAPAIIEAWLRQRAAELKEE